MSSQSLITYTGFLRNPKMLSRIALAMILVVAIAASLWFASPVKAVEVSLPTLPSTMYTSSLYSFYAQVDINTNESIPATSFRLDITGPTSAFVVFNLGGTITSQSSHFVSVTPVVVPYYGYSYGYGFGYGYQPPGGYGYFTHSWGYGYGYGYGYGSSGTTQAKYLIILNTTNMSIGSYQARLAMNVTPAPERFLSPQYSFTISALPGGGGGAPAAGVSGTGWIDLAPLLDAQGKTTVPITLTAPDAAVTVTIPAGTQMLDAEGNPIGSIQIVVLSTPPPPPGYELVGPAYDCLPNRATFSPPITLTFKYNKADVPAGTDEADLTLAYWEGDKWVLLDSTVNTALNKISASVAHFTPFAILGKLPPEPAAFKVSGLTITPAEVVVGKSVTISATVSNTGDLSGSYEITLKINNVARTTQTITLAGAAKQKVTFTQTLDKAGTYTVSLAGLSGTFTVKAPPAPPPAPPVKPPAPPAPAPPAPAPPVTPPAPAPAPPAPQAVNLLVIGGILAAAIIIAIIIWVIIRRQ